MTAANSYGWSDDDVIKLRRLAARGTLFYTEIAREMNRMPASVRWKAKKLGLPSNKEALRSRFGAWNRKHYHFHRQLLLYHQKHTFDETAKRFGLTKSEAKSCFTNAYKKRDLKHIRKSTLDHSPWSTEQLQFLLQHAGLKSRKWIAKKIGRGNVTSIKERMQVLGIASRNLQGLTLSQFKEAFGSEPGFFLQTEAGPNGGPKSSLPTRWKIVPWVWLDQEIKAKRLKIVPELRIVISSHAMFQEWIFGGNALRKMKKICREVENG